FVSKLVKHEVRMNKPPSFPQSVPPRQDDGAFVMGYASYVDLVPFFMRIRNEVTARIDQNCAYLIQVVVVKPQHKKACLAGDRDLDFVGDFEPVATFPKLLCDKDPRGIPKFRLFSSREGPVKEHVFVQIRDPFVGKG